MNCIIESNNIHLKKIEFLLIRFLKINLLLIYRITSGNSIVITGSLLGETGALINKKKKKIAKFFDYNDKEFE